MFAGNEREKKEGLFEVRAFGYCLKCWNKPSFVCMIDRKIGNARGYGRELDLNLLPTIPKQTLLL